MPKKIKNSPSPPTRFFQRSPFTDSALNYLHRFNISSMIDLKGFLRDQRNVSKLPKEVLNECLAIIENTDPIFAASFRSLYRNQRFLYQPSTKKTPISILCFTEATLKPLEAIGIQYIEDIFDNLEKISEVLTLKQLKEIEFRVAQWNDFLVKEALLLNTLTENSTPIEEIGLKLVGGTLKHWNIKTVGDLVKKYPSLYDSKNSRGLANNGKRYIVEEFYKWYTEKIEMDLYEEYRDVLIDISPLNNYLISEELEVKTETVEFDPKVEEQKLLYKLATSDVSIDELQISLRLRNSLKRWGVYTKKDLEKMLQIGKETPGADPKTVSEIQTALKNYDPQRVIETMDNMISYKEHELTTMKNNAEHEELNSFNNDIGIDVPIRVLGLSTRAFNLLARSGITTLKKLVKKEPNLSRIKGIGPSIETEVHKKLSAYLKLVEHEDELIVQKDDLGTILSKEINESDFSPRIIKLLNKLDLLSIGAIVKYLYEKSMSSHSSKRLSLEISRILKNKGFTLTEAFQLLSLDFGAIIDNSPSDTPSNFDEIKDDSEQTFTANLNQWFSILNEREMKILEQYYGLKSGEKHTLEQIAEKEGVTRERIRQIKSQVMTKLHKHHKLEMQNLFIPIAKEITKRNGIVSTFKLSHDFKGELTGSDLIAKSFFIFLKDFLKKLNEKPIYYCGNLNAWVIQAKHIDYSSLVSKNIEKCLHNGEKLPWDELYSKLVSFDGLLTLDSGFALSVANCLKDQGVVEYSLNGLWSIPRKKDRKFYYESALKSIGHPTHYKDLAKIASELAGKKFSGRNANAILSGNKEVFARVGQGIYGLAEWGLHKDGSIANAARRILHEAGRPISMKLLLNEILSEWQLEEVSVISAIDHDRRFKRFPDGQIALTEFGLLDKKYKRRRDQTKKTRLFLVLKELGIPTYFKDIAKKHNEKFPDQKLTDQKVYQTLMITDDLFIKTGTATFGLVEWGIKYFEGKKRLTRKEQLVNAFNSVNHPMGYAEMIETVQRLYPEYPISYSGVSQALRNNLDIFYRIEDGFYSLKKWHHT